jgi:hypothetical protein
MSTFLDQQHPTLGKLSQQHLVTLIILPRYGHREHVED